MKITSSNLIIINKYLVSFPFFIKNQISAIGWMCGKERNPKGKRINILRIQDEVLFNSRGEMMERDKQEFLQLIDGKLKGTREKEGTGNGERCKQSIHGCDHVTIISKNVLLDFYDSFGEISRISRF